LINFRDGSDIAGRRPIIIAHRGGVVSPRSPECSLTAIRLAAEMGYDMVELDIQRSSDAVPIVFHDSSLAQACGKSGRVSDLSATELEAIRYLGGNDRIVRLDTALKSCRLLGLGVMLDLKAGRDSREFLEVIDQLIVKHELHDSTISISGSTAARRFLKHVRFTPTDEEMRRLRRGETLDLGHRFWFGLPQQLQPGDVSKLKSAGALIIPAINTFRYPASGHFELARDDIKRLTEEGVDGFQIDSVYFPLFSNHE
jgi:glycerophosphoryl diester phosphodiesterase